MRNKLMSWSLLLVGVVATLSGVILLLIPQPVLANPLLNDLLLAQCGSQASSCKTCHEVQAEMPVNNDGTGWHESHAFGDFCIFCHAGNEQATDKDSAHTGMVPPLSDIKSGCQSCHADDLTERAQVYAVALGINLSSSGGTAEGVSPTTAPTQAPAVSTPRPVENTASEPVSSVVPRDNEIVVNDPNVMDYVQRYNEIVLGERATNWGNIILLVLIGFAVVAGGGFVIFNELRIRTAPSPLKPVEGHYPADVVDMLPAIANLQSQTRQSLKNILKQPKRSEKVLGIVETLISDEDKQE